jgi:hypothetical protein
MSVGAAHLCRSTGRVWFEVEVLKASGYIHVGFAGTSFRGKEVGGDAASWAIITDGSTQHGYPHSALIYSAATPLPSLLYRRLYRLNAASSQLSNEAS